MRRRSRRRQTGQVLPLMAILSLVIFAFAALAFDGGLVFSDKRNVQNAADSAALAGARDLAPVRNAPQARADAVQYLFTSLQLGAAPACNFTTDIDDSANVCDYPFGAASPTYRIQVFTPPRNTPTGYSSSTLLPYMLEVRVSHTLTASGFTRAAGIGAPLLAGANAVALVASSVPGNPHIAWGLASGIGDSIDVGGSVAGQFDDGSNGTSNALCGGSGPLADVLSDFKLHDPTGHDPNININGAINRATGNDNSFFQYWNKPPVVGGGPAGDPGFQPPSSNAANYTANPPPTVAVTGPPATPLTTTVTFSPGRYTSSLTVQPTGTFAGVPWTAGSVSTTFVFQNGVYWFDDANLIFVPGTYQAYSQGYDTTLNSGAGGFPSAHTAGPDGVTDGVEFYMNGSVATRGYLWAKGGIENFRAPSIVNPAVTRTGAGSNPGTSNFVGIYVDKADKGDTGEVTQNANGTVDSNPVAIGYGNRAIGYGNVSDGSQYFHLEGTVYVQPDGSPKGHSAIVEGASTNYHKYAVQGQVIAPRLGFNMGTNLNATTEPGGACVNDTTLATNTGPVKVAQFDARDVPNLNIGSSISQLVH